MMLQKDIDVHPSADLKIMSHWSHCRSGKVQQLCRKLA